MLPAPGSKYSLSIGMFSNYFLLACRNHIMLTSHRQVIYTLIISAALRTAATGLTYPVHLQILPASAALTSSSSGCGCSCKKAYVLMIKPGVQYPHCAAPSSANASWIGWSFPSCARPSMVNKSEPSAWAASIQQELMERPSRSMPQPQQSPVPQMSFVPLK